MTTYSISKLHDDLSHKFTNWWKPGDYSKHATARKLRAIAKRKKK